MVTGRDVHLRLTGVESAFLILTRLISGACINVLQGVIHLLLFYVYVLLIFNS